MYTFKMVSVLMDIFGDSQKLNKLQPDQVTDCKKLRKTEDLMELKSHLYYQFQVLSEENHLIGRDCKWYRWQLEEKNCNYKGHLKESLNMWPSGMRMKETIRIV